MSDDRPSIADLRRLDSQPRWDEDDVTEVAEALPVLLEIAAAALAMRWVRREYLTDPTVSCLRIIEAHAALDAALAKVAS